ncbi:MAG: hypothetical protein PHU43_05875 [Candidatus Bipolaricaulis sp.]|nr:hypothetical protein [Candidatus Bipolaricaulis sp.]
MAHLARVDETVKGLQHALEAVEAASLGATEQLREALRARLTLRDVLDSACAMREYIDREIEVLQRLVAQATREESEPQLLETDVSPKEETPLSELPVWRQAEIALGHAKTYLTTREIADLIKELGGNPGKRETASVGNGIGVHEDVFVLRNVNGEKRYGLRKWRDDTK